MTVIQLILDLESSFIVNLIKKKIGLLKYDVENMCCHLKNANVLCTYTIKELKTLKSHLKKYRYLNTSI